MAGAPDQGRFVALDGLRGWAALSVVVYHCLWQTFGAQFPQTHNFISSLLGNGLMAVAVFLTISGYVLTHKRWRNPANPPLYVAAVRRYLRLTIPIVAATLLVFVLMSLDLTPTRAAFRITEQRQWYDIFVRFEPNLLDALSFAFARVYIGVLPPNYNPFLWTMIIELWGSFVLFALSQNDRFLRESYSALLLLTAILLFVFPLGACFFAGALIAQAERDGVLSAPPTPLISFLASGALVALIFVGALVQMGGYDLLMPSILGTALFLAVRHSLPAQRFLTLRVSQFLGRISFPIYLVQFPVIVSLSAQLIIWAERSNGLDPTMAMLIASASVVVSLALAVLFLPVEIVTLALLRRIDRARNAPRAAAVAPAV